MTDDTEVKPEEAAPETAAQTVAGDIRRVTAIGPKIDSESYASLQIQMLATSAPSLRWSVGYAAAGVAELEITLHGEQGAVAIRIANAHGLSSWTLGFDAGGAAQAAAQVGACPARARWR